MTQDHWTRPAAEHVNGVGLFETPWPEDAAATDVFPLPTFPVARRSRRGLAITVGAVIVLAVVGLVIVLRGSASTLPTSAAVATPAAGATQPSLTPLGGASPASSAGASSTGALSTAGPSTAAVSTPAVSTGAASAAVPSTQSRFVDDVLATPGLNTGLSRDDILTAGLKLCAAIPTVPSHAALIGLLTKAAFDPRVVEVVLTAAEKDLCPQTTYGHPA